MTPETLDRLEQLAAAATPGPWHERNGVIKGPTDDIGDWLVRCEYAEDAAYIAALSPAVVSELVAAARLGAAWEAAEGALPEGWRLLELQRNGDEWRASAAPTPAYRATFQSTTWLGTGTRGPTPAAALLALAEKLRERP